MTSISHDFTICDRTVADMAARCASLRKARGLSLDEAGKRAGITKSHMWEFEQGRAVNPTIRMMIGLARAYGVSLAYVIGTSTDTPPLHPEAIRIAADIDRLLRASRTKVSAGDQKDGGGRNPFPDYSPYFCEACGKSILKVDAQWTADESVFHRSCLPSGPTPSPSGKEGGNV